MKILLSIVFLFCTHAGMAQDHLIPLYEDQIPNSRESDLEEIQEMTDVLRISQVINPTIEVYLPSKAHATGQAVMICPGGGYSILAYDKEGTDIAKWLNGYGIAGIVLKYRLPEDESNEVPHRSPLIDAKRGMELIRSNAEDWSIDPEKVGVMGFSAGGHLASTLGTHFEESNRPDFMALIYPVVTMNADYTNQGSRTQLLGENPPEDLVMQYSNELQVTPNTPPSFIIHTGDDEAVPVKNSLQMFQALKEQNVPTEMHLYPIGGHGYSMGLEEDRLSGWSDLFIEWLKDI